MAKDSRCKTTGCGKDPEVRGLCESCYRKWYTSGTFQPVLQTAERHSLTQVDRVAETAVCSVCGPTRVRLRAGRRGNECLTVRQRHSRERDRTKRTSEDPKAKRAARLKALYGLSKQGWDAMVLQHEGRCAICADPLLVPQIDHDHSTGAVRGILCRGCNLGIGFLRDDPTILQGALRYLSA